MGTSSCPTERAEAIRAGGREQLRLAVEQRIRQIELFPFSGRIVPEFGIELVREVIEPPFRIIYEVFPDRVEVVAMRHGRQDIDATY